MLRHYQNIVPIWYQKSFNENKIKYTRSKAQLSSLNADKFQLTSVIRSVINTKHRSIYTHMLFCGIFIRKDFVKSVLDLKHGVTYFRKWHLSSQRLRWLHILSPHRILTSLRWRHNDHAGVSNHQLHACLLNRLFRRRWKKTSKFRVTDFVREIHRIGEFPAQIASNAENASIWWRHHGFTGPRRWMNSKPFDYFSCRVINIVRPVDLLFYSW